MIKAVQKAFNPFWILAEFGKEGLRGTSGN
jgi:hypothetical protein